MSTRKLVGGAVLLLFAASLAFFLLQPSTPTIPTPSTASPPRLPTSPDTTQRGVIPSTSATRTDLLKDPARATVVPRTADGFVEWATSIAAAKTLNSADQTGADDIVVVRGLVTDYHAVFRENPPGGENEEITRALLGDNPKKIRFLAPEKTLLDADGALIDRWGKPYFFHKLSRDTMDLRSAGPDRKLWTPDDLIDESPGDRPPL